MSFKFCNLYNSSTPLKDATLSYSKSSPRCSRDYNSKKYLNCYKLKTVLGILKI